ncbi:hypothetical protein VC83_01472 [Pseudogymnoascus destructans]|uniref:Uncharacterized protein n=1 Tax=Pseudogymnoascus destructans TaxID=655981 RepID=A0A177AKT5_9PEZI|nr:uncharacterized protein VC83_01472 [Pseudogymnoascus destructans]OAF62112.1 hypothetical protein VC83_01472 [Pseudogymnoascus destructans]
MARTKQKPERHVDIHKTARRARQEKIWSYNAQKRNWERDHPGSNFPQQAPRPVPPLSKASVNKRIVAEIRHYQKSAACHTDIRCTQFAIKLKSKLRNLLLKPTSHHTYLGLSHQQQKQYYSTIAANSSTTSVYATYITAYHLDTH